jgi:hypothetical protein
MTEAEIWKKIEQFFEENFQTEKIRPLKQCYF